MSVSIDRRIRGSSPISITNNSTILANGEWLYNLESHEILKLYRPVNAYTIDNQHSKTIIFYRNQNEDEPLRVLASTSRTITSRPLHDFLIVEDGGTAVDAGNITVTCELEEPQGQDILRNIIKKIPLIHPLIKR